MLPLLARSSTQSAEVSLTAPKSQNLISNIPDSCPRPNYTIFLALYTGQACRSPHWAEIGGRQEMGGG